MINSMSYNKLFSEKEALSSAFLLLQQQNVELKESANIVEKKSEEWASLQQVNQDLGRKVSQLVQQITLLEENLKNEFDIKSRLSADLELLQSNFAAKEVASEELQLLVTTAQLKLNELRSEVDQLSLQL